MKAEKYKLSNEDWKYGVSNEAPENIFHRFSSLSIWYCYEIRELKESSYLD